VGEIGLDYSVQGIGSKEAQIGAFRSIASWLSKSPKFVTLHTRKSASDVLAILMEVGVSDAVFHWYSDSAVVLRKAIDAGFYFSINEAMLESQSGQRVLAAVPHDRILTETDGPYVKSGRKPSTPLDVARIIDGIAKAWGLGKEDVQDRIDKNFRVLCKKLLIGLPKDKDGS
jgi:TatD DNase family protein